MSNSKHLSKSTYFAFTLLALIGSYSTHAEVPTLSNLSSENVDEAVKTFGALMNFRPLEPAGSFGKYFGVSLGLVAQAAPSSKLKNFIPNSGSVPAYLPDANIVGAIQAPLGIALEFGFFPAKTFKSFHLEQYAGNLKWAVTDVFFSWLPIDVAVRGGYVADKLGFTQTVSGIPVNIDYTQKMWNFNLSVGKKLWIFEPYAGAGIVSQSATLAANAAGTFSLFGQSVPYAVGNSVDQSITSPVFFAGAQIHLFAFNITLQDDYQFGLNNLALKLAFKF